MFFYFNKLLKEKYNLNHLNIVIKHNLLFVQHTPGPFLRFCTFALF